MTHLVKREKPCMSSSTAIPCSQTSTSTSYNKNGYHPLLMQRDEVTIQGRICWAHYLKRFQKT